MTRDDRYKDFDYRRMVAWPARLQREMPFFLKHFRDSSTRRILDLGCGPGEHVRALAGEGYRGVGLDSSAAMLEKAGAPLGGASFVRADITALPFGADAKFGGVLCLGNTIVHVATPAELYVAFRGIHALLEPGGPLIIQILNYTRLREKKIRHLPLSFRPGDDGEMVFLRLIDFEDERTVRFEVITLLRDSDGGEVKVARSSTSLLTPLYDDDLVTLLSDTGFDVSLHGAYDGTPYERLESSDVIVVATPR